MSEADRERWNARHAGGHDAREPLPSLLQALERPELAALRGGRALDLACGTGRHALALARAGFRVLAVDVSDVALERVAERARAESLDVRVERRDLPEDGLPDGPFDLIVVTDFLDRGLVPALIAALAPGGMLFYETFTWRHSEATGFRRAFCLEEGELERGFEELDVIEHRDEGARERLIARRPRV